MSADVFREPAEVFADIDAANLAINAINSRIQSLARQRSAWEALKSNARSELKAIAGPDGHLPGCSRSDRCFGEGWCR